MFFCPNKSKKKIFLEKISLFEGNRCVASLNLKLQIFNAYMKLKTFFLRKIYKMHVFNTIRKKNPMDGRSHVILRIFVSQKN